MPALKFWDGTRWTYVEGAPGPQGPQGAIGAQGPQGGPAGVNPLWGAVTGEVVLSTRVAGDTEDRFQLQAGGTMAIGPGGGTAPLSFLRQPTNTLLLGAEVGPSVTGQYNVGIGPGAFGLLTNGTSNTAVGFKAGPGTGSVTYTTYVGYQAGQASTSSSATGFGAEARSNANGVAVGIAASGGINGVAIGTQSSGGGSGGIAIGYQASQAQNGAIAIGAQATANVTGTVAIGAQSIATSTGATAIGYQAGRAGNNATFVGYQAGQAGSSGSNSTGIGALSQTSTSAVAVGFQSNAGANGIAVGRLTQSSTSAVAIGYQASASGGSGIAIGNQARNDTLGGIAIGGSAWSYGTNSTVIGNGATALQNNSLALGANTRGSTGGVAIGTDDTGAGASGARTNLIRLGTALHITEVSGFATAFAFKTADYDMVRADHTIVCNTAGITIRLPDPNNNRGAGPGAIYKVINNSAVGSVTVVPYVTETIGGVASPVVLGPKQVLEVTTENLNWYIINQPTFPKVIATAGGALPTVATEILNNRNAAPSYGVGLYRVSGWVRYSSFATMVAINRSVEATRDDGFRTAFNIVLLDTNNNAAGTLPSNGGLYTFQSQTIYQGIEGQPNRVAVSFQVIFGGGTGDGLYAATLEQLSNA